MAKQLVTVTGSFQKPGIVINLAIPNHSSEAAFRLHRNPGSNPEIEIVMIQDTNDQAGFHNRAFLMSADPVLPDGFIKYVGTIPFGPGKVMVHIIEVAAQ